MKILVLGANGFIGRRLLSVLGERLGRECVIAGVRRASAAPAGFQYNIVDACDPDAMLTAARLVSHVVTCVMGSDRAIVESARTLANVAAQMPLEGIVHFSSVAVYGSREGNIDEATPQGEGVDSYGAAKVEAERLLAEVPCDSLTILRPALVYGPGSWLWTERIARLLKARRIGDMGTAGQGSCNLVHVEDVTAFAVEAAISAAAGRYSFNLVGPHPVDWNAYLNDFAEALGYRPRSVSSARLAIEGLAAYPFKVAEMLGGKVGVRTPTPLTPSLRAQFRRTERFDVRAAEEKFTGWTPYRQGLAESAAWARDFLE